MIIEPVIDFAEAVDEVVGNKSFTGLWFREVLNSHSIPYRILTVNVKELIAPEMSVVAITNGWDQDKMLCLWKEQKDSNSLFPGVLGNKTKFTCLVIPMERAELIKIITKTMNLKAFI